MRAGKSSMNGAVGVLALQGCIEPHRRHLSALGYEMRELRRAKDFENIAGIILPGGESTTLLKLIETLGLHSTLVDTLNRVPCWGICAGAILMARNVLHPQQQSFSSIDIDIVRNGYGRQLDSHFAALDESTDDVHSVAAKGWIYAWIRAPRITRLGTQVRALGKHKGEVVWALQDHQMVTTFHPELAEREGPQSETSRVPSPIHRFFVEMIERRAHLHEPYTNRAPN